MMVLGYSRVPHSHYSKTTRLLVTCPPLLGGKKSASENQWRRPTVPGGLKGGQSGKSPRSTRRDAALTSSSVRHGSAPEEKCP